MSKPKTKKKTLNTKKIYKRKTKLFPKKEEKLKIKCGSHKTLKMHNTNQNNKLKTNFLTKNKKTKKRTKCGSKNTGKHHKDIET